MTVLLLEALVVLGLIGLLGGLLVRMGVREQLRLSLSRSGLNRRLVIGLSVVAVIVIGATSMFGTPTYHRFRLTGSEIGLILFLVGLGLVGLAGARLEDYRKLTSAVPALEGEIGDPVVLTGEVQPEEAGCLESPHTDTACLAYDTRVETLLRGVRISTPFYAMDERTAECVPFTVESGLRTVPVDPTGAQLCLPVREAPAADESRLLLDRVLYGVDEEAEAPCRRRSERWLEPGDTVGVIGSLTKREGHRRVDADAIFLDQTYEKRLRRTVRRNGPLGLIVLVAGLAIMAITAGFL